MSLHGTIELYQQKNRTVTQSVIPFFYLSTSFFSFLTGYSHILFNHKGILKIHQSKNMTPFFVNHHAFRSVKNFKRLVRLPHKRRSSVEKTFSSRSPTLTHSHICVCVCASDWYGVWRPTFLSHRNSLFSLVARVQDPHISYSSFNTHANTHPVAHLLFQGRTRWVYKLSQITTCPSQGCGVQLVS